MQVVSHPEAEKELEAAAVWYEGRQADLGDDFLDEFERTLPRIVAEPERWRKTRGEIPASRCAHAQEGIQTASVDRFDDL